MRKAAAAYDTANSHFDLSYSFLLGVKTSFLRLVSQLLALALGKLYKLKCRVREACRSSVVTRFRPIRNYPNFRSKMYLTKKMHGNTCAHSQTLDGICLQCDCVNVQHDGR
jgi:hypothetical protein